MAPAHNIARAVTKETLGSSATIYLNIWIYFNLIGNNIFLPLIVLTFLFSKTAKRHPILINLCMTWIFSGVFSLLLFYKKQHVGPEPDLSLCIAQASLLFGITPMWSVAVLAMIYYMFHTLRGGPCLSRLWKGFPMAIVLSAPYVVQCSFSIAALLLALRNPDKVSRHSGFFFCAVDNIPLFLVMSFFTLIVCVFIIIFEVALAVIVYRSWRTRQSAGLPSGLPVPLIVRMFMFGVYVLIGLVVDVLSIFVSILPGDIFAAIAGTVVVLIFGTQGDVFRAWCFWRKNDDDDDDDDDDDGIDPAISRQRKPNLDIRSSTTTSIGSIFMSPKPDQRFSWPDRLTPLPTRLPSQRSSRRSSRKTFVRLRDEDEIEETYREMTKRNTMRLAEASTANEDWDVIPSRKSSRQPSTNGQKKNGGKQVQGHGRLESAGSRRKMRVNPPRPKGPRKASSHVSSWTTPLVAGSYIRKPAASFQPAELPHTVFNSSRTLDIRNADPSVPLS